MIKRLNSATHSTGTQTTLQIATCDEMKIDPLGLLEVSAACNKAPTAVQQRGSFSWEEPTEVQV